MIRAGTTMVCTECGRALYRITRDFGEHGEILTSNLLQPLAGQTTSAGDQVRCPEHGPISCYAIPPPGPFPEPATDGLRLTSWEERGIYFALDDE